MNKFIIKIIIALTVFTTYAQDTRQYYFYYWARMESTPDEMLNGYSYSDPKGNFIFKSQIFECTLAKNDNIFHRKLDDDEQAYAKFKNFVINYVRQKHPEWIKNPMFKIDNHSIYEFSSFNEANSHHRSGNQIEFVNYYGFSGCPPVTIQNERTASQQNQNNSTGTKTQSIGNISTVSSKTSSNFGKNQVYFDAKSNMYTTPEIEAIKARSQAKYDKKMQKVQLISNAVTGLVNYFEQQRQRRLAYEERQRQLKAQEDRKKELFWSQVSQYRKEYKKIINARKSFVNQPKLKSTLDEDGTGFKPLYIYFAYVPKNYDYYDENVRYPSTLDFRIENNVNVQFSPVFGFFPYSNGQYPFIKDVKNQILYDHFGNKAKDYDVVFFQWENSVDDIISSLKGNLNKAVNESYFASAIPSSEKNIVFLNSKINASESKDYWTGKKVKAKETKKVDYFKTDKNKSSNKKTDYWKTNNSIKPKKDTLKTKKKKVNYWDN